MSGKPCDTDTPEFLLFYSRTLLREYRVRARGPIGKKSWGHLLRWAYKAKRQYWCALKRENAQGDLFA